MINSSKQRLIPGEVLFTMYEILVKEYLSAVVNPAFSYIHILLYILLIIFLFTIVCLVSFLIFLSPLFERFFTNLIKYDCEYS